MKICKSSVILLLLVLAFTLCACGGGTITTGEASEYLDEEGVSSGGSTAGGEVTISIECATILDHMENLDKSKQPLIPEDGVLLAETTVAFEEGDTVMDVLQKVTMDHKMHMEFEESPAYDGGYVNGINNIYEFDCGAGSGWKYFVNGWEPNYGCGKYILTDGDVIQWRYTCDNGQDLK